MKNLHPIFLAKTGNEQILITPPKFAIDATEVLLRKEGERLIIEPPVSHSLLSVLTNLSEIEEDFPDVDDTACSPVA